MTDVEYFARNIKYLRQLKQFKQEDIASLFNVTSQAVSKWETAKSLPDIKTLLSIAEYFHVSMEDLISKEISNENIKIQNDKSVEEEIKQPKLYSYYSDVKDSKESQMFYIINIILIVLNVLSIATWFIPINNLISLIVLIVASIVNLVGCPIYIKAIGKIKRHALIRAETYTRYMKVAIPITMVSMIWFIIVTIVLNEAIVWYILLLILYLIITIGLVVAAFIYQKILNNK